MRSKRRECPTHEYVSSYRHLSCCRWNDATKKPEFGVSYRLNPGLTRIGRIVLLSSACEPRVCVGACNLFVCRVRVNYARASICESRSHVRGRRAERNSCYLRIYIEYILTCIAPMSFCVCARVRVGRVLVCVLACVRARAAFTYVHIYFALPPLLRSFCFHAKAAASET